MGENVASSLAAGSVLSSPMQLGPTMRMPAARTCVDQLRLARAALAAGLAEARR